MRYRLDPFTGSIVPVLDPPRVIQSSSFAMKGDDGRVIEIVAGDNISVDSSDPARPIVAGSGQTKIFIVVGPDGDSGYVTDGTADEVQINAAINTVNTSGGGTVYLQAGTFVTAATIVLKSNVALVGGGIGISTVTGSGSDYRLAGTSPSGTTKTLYENIAVRGISFVSAQGTCLAIFNTDNVSVTDCESAFTVTTPIRQGIFLQHCQNVVINGNNVHDYTGNGISVTSTDYFTIANNIITGGTNGDDGIDVDYDFLDTSAIASNFGTVVGNVVKVIGRGNGIRVENSNYVAVGDNSVDDVTTSASISAGIMINTSSTNTGTGITVTGNVVTNCDPGGIAVSGTNLTLVTVSGNTVVNCGANAGSVRGGILLNAAGVNCVNNLISGTLKSGTDGAGLLIYKKDGHNIRGNSITSCVTGIRAWNGDSLQSYTSTVISGNQYSGNTTDAVLSALTATSQEFNNHGQASYANSLNQIAVTNAIAGSSPIISAVGTSTNINLTLTPKGTGVVASSSDLTVPDEAYGAGWNASLEVPTKNAVYDKIETITAGSGISEELAIAYAVSL